MKDLTQKQKSALKRLEAAFKQCKSAGLVFCGMDHDVYYTSEQCLKTYEAQIKGLDCRGGSYHPVAQVQNLAHWESDFRVGKVDTNRAYKESGGW